MATRKPNILVVDDVEEDYGTNTNTTATTQFYAVIEHFNVIGEGFPLHFYLADVQHAIDDRDGFEEPKVKWNKLQAKIVLYDGLFWMD